jgi:phospholipase C
MRCKKSSRSLGLAISTSAFCKSTQGMRFAAKGLALLALLGAIVAHAQITSFTHIVIVFQENRTPDNLFQGLCGPNRTLCPQPYDLQNFGINSRGNKIPLILTTLGAPYDPKHSHEGFVHMCDLDTTTNQCRMDGLGSAQCSSGNCSFQYIDPLEVRPYITMAKYYGWANFMFETSQGGSPPAHQFIFAGTSAPSAADDADAIFVAERTSGRGCLAPLNYVYPMISPESAPGTFDLINNPLGTVCFSHDTMATLLDNHNPPLSWKYYTPEANDIWTAPNWIREICVPDSDYQNCTGKEWLDNVDTNPADVLSDIAACHLPDMIWVIPRGQDSDHPGPNGNIGGPSWVASIVNAIGESKCKNADGSTYWDSTAIFITWDDWGGWYDHEPPTLLSVPQQGQGDFQYGFRVPLVVVSAYTRVGYVSNLRYDFGSILRFAEQNFAIPEGALHFADERATYDLTDFFRLDHAPRIFHHINAPKDAKYFLNDKSPMEPPDND